MASYSSTLLTPKIIPAAVGVATFASNCTTPQTAFPPSSTVCAQVTGIDPPIANARFDFVDPDGVIQQRGPDITLDGQTATFTLPANPTAGTWKVNISYISDSSVIATTDFTIIACPAIMLNPPALPNATINVAYGQTITASPAGSYTFSVTSGAAPSGLTLNPNGTWSGAPTTLGSSTFTITAQDSFGCTGSQSYTLTVACPVVSLTPTILPNTPSGSPYSQQLIVTASGSFSFSLSSGLLPTGITLSPSGLLSGTPTVSGTFNFRVTATAFGSCSGFFDYTLVVDCTSIDLTPASLPGGVVGTAYNQTVSGTPSGTYSYAVTSGALPLGLTLNGSTGQLSGMPITNGTSSFTITATAGACTGSRNYSVTIGCSGISFTTTPPLPAGQAGIAYSQTLNVTPAGSYTFSLVSGSLPTGLVLNSSTGGISGTPTGTGVSGFTVKADAGNGCFATQAYSLVIGCPAVVLSPASLPGGTAGTSFSQTIVASPAGGSYTYSVTSGALPPGLNLNPSTGSLSGTPTTNGSSTFTVTATGFGGCTGSQAFTIVIGSGGSCPAITLAALPNGNVGQLYTSAVTPSPAGSYSFVVTAGSLPPGLTLFDFLGLIYGYPSLAGSYTFTITATDGNNCTGSQQYTVNIGAALASSLTVFSDFDGDGKSDLSVFRGSDGNWFVANSGDGQLQSTPWGAGYAPYNDLAVSGDYDGDGKTDLAVFRRGGGQAGYWFIKRSSDGQIQRQFWGLATDVPVPGDYDGDGKTDIAVWRGSAGAWYILRSSDGGVQGITWGTGTVGDTPVPGDYDGDGKTDVAVFRRMGQQAGHWLIKRSSDAATMSVEWGVGSDVPVAGDYDGDGKTDFAVWRAADGNWYIIESGSAMLRTVTLGAAGEVPVPADYDGDGKADAAIWQPATGSWQIKRSSDGTVQSKTLGQSGDSPIPAKR